MESEAWFERYLRDTGHGGWDDHEPDLGIPSNPDYLISKAGALAVCEVEEFADGGLHRRLNGRHNQTMALSDFEMYGAVRNKIKKAAKQMKPLDGRRLPLVAVLANPRRVIVPCDDFEIGAAMYGCPRFGGAFNPDVGAVEELHPIRGLNGRLTTSHSYLSAVVFLHVREHLQDAHDAWIAETREERDRLCGRNVRKKATMLLDGLNKIDGPSGDYVFARVFHTIAAHEGSAVPLPRTLFDGEHDIHRFPDALGSYA